MSQTTGHASSLSDFDLAASVCGHDTSTVIGAEDARRDHRVWDLLDLPRAARHQLLDDLIDETLLESIASLNGHAPSTVAQHLDAARAVLRKDRT